jgi:hypothetical protein
MKLAEDVYSISKHHAENNLPWTKANHRLVAKLVNKLLEYSRRERERKLREKYKDLKVDAKSKELPETIKPEVA